MEMSHSHLSASSKAKVVKAIVATAATTLVIALMVFFFFFFFFFFRKIGRWRWWKRGKYESSFRREAVVIPDEFLKYGEKVKGLVVEENRRDVLCMKKLDDRRLKNEFPKVMFNPSYEEDEGEKRMDTTVEIQRSKNSKSREDFQFLDQPSDVILPPVSTTLPPEPSPAMVSMKKTTPNPPPPPPSITPPAPLNQARTNSAAPPLPPAAGISVPVLKPPTAPRGTANNRDRPNTSPENRRGAGFGQLKLRPLHWDKVIADSDHSMVWDQIKDGSLRFDDELIETLFGYTTANRKSPDRNNISSTSGSSGNTPTAQIFIVEPRKSQNSAIVLKSLGISRAEIIGALSEGQGLSAEVLEKLTKIAPTREEEAKILHFNGNPRRLPDAESFFYHVLKAVPSAFIRIKVMLFRSNYDSELLNLKESLQTLESACKELRNRGLFLKLLEAILKAGNRMNAGTARGNALGFNLTALQKLSDVKSTDGKTTLLHFVVEQVARSEGRRHTMNMIFCTNGDVKSDNLMPEEKDREYLMLGLPALAALGSEFSNVKTAATIEYESFINLCSNLTSRVAESKQLLPLCACGNSQETGFEMEMKGFLEECEDELKVVREEQKRVMELVKKTTDYYQAGASKLRGANPLQLFVIVKDFLDMVDRVRADITRKLQLTNGTHSAGSSPPPTPPRRNPLKLINFRTQFMSSEMSTTTSSESDDDF
ncbi:formin 8, FORMIN HOMOLOGUE 8 [Hibiscus trionum]|nr:formin 8, FORMIN HOMOLOGUE 8 [Hibiscus trionum]